MSAAPPPPYTLPQSEVPQALTSPEASGDDDIYIAVMGVTGSGKSKFIADCSGKHVKIGHTLESCTAEVDEYTFNRKGQKVHLIDTPGFDDTHRSDRAVLEDIAAWMGNSYCQNIELCGILYLHRIIDVKLGGTANRNLLMFKELCGNDFYPRVFLVTTMWDKVPYKEGQARQEELIGTSNFWGNLIKGGANVEQHWGTRDSAIDILSAVIRNGRKAPGPGVLKVQREMVDEKLQLDETGAGKQFEVELIKQRERHRKEIEQIQADIKALLKANETKAAKEEEMRRKTFEDRIAQSYDDQVKLRSSLKEIQERQAQQIAELQEQWERDRAVYEEKIERLERERYQLSKMDRASSRTQAFASQIEQEEAEAEQLQKKLETEKETIQKKMKKLFVRGREWMRKNPNAVKYAMGGLKSVSRLLAQRHQQQAAARHAGSSNSAAFHTFTVEEIDDAQESPAQLDAAYHRSFDAYR